MTGRRTRSLGGCATCRTRHVKCDETRPRCLICNHDGVKCLGYGIRISFDTADETSAAEFRRPLCSSSEQERQTLLLSRSLQRNSAQRLLDQIDRDSACFDEDSNLSVGSHYGPFGVFKASRVDQARSRITHECIQPVCTLPNSLETLSVLVADTPPESFFYEPEDMTSVNSATASMQLMPSPSDSVTLPLWSTSETELPRPCLRKDRELVQTALESVIYSPLDLTTSRELCLKPDVASLLVSNYREAVIPCLSLFPFRKTPWHIIVLPNSINTLGTLSLGDQPNFANLATFYAVLSMSAYNLGSFGSETKKIHWTEKGQHFRSKADFYLQMSLYVVLSTRKTAKYKENLTALLTMITVSIFTEEWGQTEQYLVEAENLIRLRGLPKPKKSRKIRLLHHCYTYMRLFYESTFASFNYLCSRNVQENSMFGGTLSASVGSAFRLGTWDSDLRQKMLEIKNYPLGENDLLLECPGKWDLTMYPSIFGVPEDLLFLISQVVRLGNEKEILESIPRASLLTAGEFAKRARTLERCIRDWSPPRNFLIENDDLHVDQSIVQTSFKVLRELLSALHDALAIYFYRRVYDIDAALLQEKVRNIAACIQRCNQGENKLLKCSSAFVWPALVGACEALDPDLQESYDSWFGICYDRIGLRSFAAALAMIREVWLRRSQSDGNEVNWIAILKSHNLRLLYT